MPISDFFLHAINSHEEESFGLQEIAALAPTTPQHNPEPIIVQSCSETSAILFFTSTAPLTESQYQLSGVGDLMLTAYGKQSRNRNLGIKLGKGMKLKNILSSSKTVAEGYYSSKAAYELTKKFKISSPVIESIYKILYKNSSPQNIVKSLSKNDLITDI